MVQQSQHQPKYSSISQQHPLYPTYSQNNGPHQSDPINYQKALHIVPTFAGNSSVDVITFFNEIEAVFKSNPGLWTDERKIHACKSKLSGVALQLVYSALSKISSYSEMKKNILTLFAQDQVETLTIELNKATKKPGETYIAFYARIKAIANAITHFDKHFDEDRSCALVLLDNVDPILRNELIKEFRANRISSLQVMKIILDHNEPSPRTNPIDTHFHNIQEEVPVAAVKTYDSNKTRQTQNEERRQEHTPANKGKPYKQLNLPTKCSRCEEWGHQAYDCKGKGNNGDAGRKYPPIYCTNCDEWTSHGNRNRFCPNNNNNQTFSRSYQDRKPKKD